MTRSARRDDRARGARGGSRTRGDAAGDRARGGGGSPGGRDDGREARGGPGGAARGGAAAAKRRGRTREPTTSAPGIVAPRAPRDMPARGRDGDASWSTRGARPKPAAQSHRQPRRSRFIQEHCWTPDARFITRCAARSASVENSRTVAASPTSRFSPLSLLPPLLFARARGFLPPAERLEDPLEPPQVHLHGPPPRRARFLPPLLPPPAPPRTRPPRERRRELRLLARAVRPWKPVPIAAQRPRQPPPNTSSPTAVHAANIAAATSVTALGGIAPLRTPATPARSPRRRRPEKCRVRTPSPAAPPAAPAPTPSPPPSRRPERPPRRPPRATSAGATRAPSAWTRRTPAAPSPAPQSPPPPRARETARGVRSGASAAAHANVRRQGQRVERTLGVAGSRGPRIAKKGIDMATTEAADGTSAGEPTRSDACVSATNARTSVERASEEEKPLDERASEEEKPLASPPLASPRGLSPVLSSILSSAATALSIAVLDASHANARTAADSAPRPATRTAWSLACLAGFRAKRPRASSSAAGAALSAARDPPTSSAAPAAFTTAARPVDAAATVSSAARRTRRTAPRAGPRKNAAAGDESRGRGRLFRRAPPRARRRRGARARAPRGTRTRGEAKTRSLRVRAAGPFRAAPPASATRTARAATSVSCAAAARRRPAS